MTASFNIRYENRFRYRPPARAQVSSRQCFLTIDLLSRDRGMLLIFAPFFSNRPGYLKRVCLHGLSKLQDDDHNQGKLHPFRPFAPPLS